MTRPGDPAPPSPRAGWSRWPRPWRGVVALLLAVVVGFGGWSTWAYWSDQAAVTTGSFASGQLDLRLDGEQASGLGTAYSKTSITLGSMLPGESQAYALVLNNGGNPAVTYQVAVIRGSTWTYVDNALELRVFLGTPANAAGPPRAGSCSGASLSVATPVLATSSTPVTARPLAANSTEAICLVVSMPTGVTNTNQSKTGTMVITVTANQAT